MAATVATASNADQVAATDHYGTGLAPTNESGSGPVARWSRPNMSTDYLAQRAARERARGRIHDTEVSEKRSWCCLALRGDWCDIDGR